MKNLLLAFVRSEVTRLFAVMLMLCVLFAAAMPTYRYFQRQFSPTIRDCIMDELGSMQTEAAVRILVRQCEQAFVRISPALREELRRILARGGLTPEQINGMTDGEMAETVRARHYPDLAFAKFLEQGEKAVHDKN